MDIKEFQSVYTYDGTIFNNDIIINSFIVKCILHFQENIKYKNIKRITWYNSPNDFSLKVYITYEI